MVKIFNSLQIGFPEVFDFMLYKIECRYIGNANITTCPIMLIP